MKALVIVEHNNKSIKTSTFSTITAASQICDSVDALIVGNQLQEAVDEIKKADDLKKIYVIDKGSVESSGRHDDLIKNSSLYKNFYERQIKNNWCIFYIIY